MSVYRAAVVLTLYNGDAFFCPQSAARAIMAPKQRPVSGGFKHSHIRKWPLHWVQSRRRLQDQTRQDQRARESELRNIHTLNVRRTAGHEELVSVVLLAQLSQAVNIPDFTNGHSPTRQQVIVENLVATERPRFKRWRVSCNRAKVIVVEELKHFVATVDTGKLQFAPWLRANCLTVGLAQLSIRLGQTSADKEDIAIFECDILRFGAFLELAYSDTSRRERIVRLPGKGVEVKKHSSAS